MSSTFLDKIPTHPPDQPVRDRLFGDNLGSENSAFVVLRRGGRLFVPLKFLNKLLSSAARPLRIDIATNTDADGDLQFTLGLRDLGGAPVEMAAPGPALQRGLQQGANSGQGGYPGDGGRGLRERNQERRRAPVVIELPESPGSVSEVLDLSNPRASSQSLQTRGPESQPTASSALAQVRQSSIQSDSGQQPLGSKKIEEDTSAPSPTIGRVSPQNDNINTPDVSTPKSEENGEDASAIQDDGLRGDETVGPPNSQDQTTVSGASLRSRFLNGMKAWEQLREMRIIDFDVLGDFLHDLHPKALSALVGVPNTLVPLFKLPNGERYMVKISTGTIWAPQTLLISETLTVDTVCKLKLRSQIQ